MEMSISNVKPTTHWGPVLEASAYVWEGVCVCVSMYMHAQGRGVQNSQSLAYLSDLLPFEGQEGSLALWPLFLYSPGSLQPTG